MSTNRRKATTLHVRRPTNDSQSLVAATQVGKYFLPAVEQGPLPLTVALVAIIHMIGLRYSGSDIGSLF